MVLHEKLKDYKLILASQSPRRKMLLQGLDLDFEVYVKDGVDESVPDGLDKFQVPVFLAEKKSKVYSDIIKERTILITADTIVWVNNKLLGKPENANHATEMLRELSGVNHEVITGVCISSLKQRVSFYALSEVYFRQLTNEEINYYISRYKPYDKAGSYGIQEWIGYTAIEKIEGSFYNVMGLPVQTLYLRLEKFLIDEENKTF